MCLALRRLAARLISLRFLALLPPLTLLFNEFLIYYIVLSQCRWGGIDGTNVMILADTHLLGVRNGHWFDKLRREWQMHRAFQSAMTLHRPDAVFFLGDLYDEGQWATDKQFDAYAERFDALFAVPKHVRRYTVAGNHDIGFHYAVMPGNLQRFERRHGAAAVARIELNGNHIVLVNSMALEGDGCRLCERALSELSAVASTFECSLNGSSTCAERLQTPYSRPILMQHFPLYRQSDLECRDTDDVASAVVRATRFRAKWDCLARDSTEHLLRALRPRAAFGGHVHFGCERWWSAPYNLWEYTIASFSWRNNVQPSFLLASLAPHELHVERCFLPHEHTVVLVYASAALLWVACIVAHVYTRLRGRRRRSSLKSS